MDHILAIEGLQPLTTYEARVSYLGSTPLHVWLTVMCNPDERRGRLLLQKDAGDVLSNADIKDDTVTRVEFAVESDDEQQQQQQQHQRRRKLLDTEKLHFEEPAACKRPMLVLHARYRGHTAHGVPVPTTFDAVLIVEPLYVGLPPSVWQLIAAGLIFTATAMIFVRPCLCRLAKATFLAKS